MLHLILVDFDKRCINFIGDTSAAHIGKMLQNMAAFAGHFLGVEQWNLLMQDVKISNNLQAAPIRQARILLALSWSMCSRQVCNVDKFTPTDEGELLSWAARLYHGKTLLRSATRELFDDKLALPVAAGFQALQVPNGVDFNGQIYRWLLQNTVNDMTTQERPVAER